MSVSIKETARKLAEENAKSEERIVRIYLFPHEEEVRLLELDESMVESDEVTPFYFGPTPEITAPSGIAVIRPEEFEKLDLPEAWGTWADAELIWEKS